MDSHLITWPSLTKGTLIRRYKRFMADVALEDGRTVTAHCPNSGRMLACSEPGRTVYLSHTDKPGRKFPYTWEIIHMPKSLVVVNTLRANQAVTSGVRRGMIPELSGYTSIIPEVRVSDLSRIDLLLKGEDRNPCMVEVKSSTLVEHGRAVFPDAVTERGLRHVRELTTLLKQGYRCVIFFLIQRMDAHTFSPADHIDPAYGRGLRTAHACGVEIIVYDTRISPSGMELGRNISCIL